MPRRALRSIFIVMAPSQTVSGNGVERHDRRFLERAVFVDVVARGFSTDGHQITVNAEYLAADIDQRHLRLGETLDHRMAFRSRYSGSVPAGRHDTGGERQKGDHRVIDASLCRRDRKSTRLNSSH